MRNPSFMMLGFMAVALVTSAPAQETNQSEPEPSLTSAREKTAINLWPGVAPGSEQWKQPVTVIGSVGSRRIMNVSVPTLTAYLPDPSTATGTSVIIAPGGGFVWLSIDSEGHKQGKSSDHWIDEFYFWLESLGLTRATK